MFKNSLKVPINKDLNEFLFHQKKMKQKLVKLIDKILLRKYSLIEMVNNQRKNISQIEHSRNRSVWNCLINLCARLTAYTHLPEKLSFDSKSKDKLALSPAVFKQPL